MITSNNTKKEMFMYDGKRILIEDAQESNVFVEKMTESCHFFG